MTDAQQHKRNDWLVVGKGAIGLLTACQLQQQGELIRLWLRQPTELQVVMTTLSGAVRHHHFAPWPKTQAARLAFIAVKAYDALPCIQQLQTQLAEDACVILSHNGLGTLTNIQAALKPRQQLWFLTTTHGAYTQSDCSKGHQLVHSGSGSSVIGKITPAGSEAMPGWFDALGQALGPLTLVERIQPFLWQKLLVNCLINPLTALHQVPNGALAEARFETTLKKLFAEYCQLAAAAGYPQQETAAWQQLQQVISNTASNRSSMLQDRLAGRKTELDFITGFVLREADRLALTLPAHQQLYQDCLAAGF